MKMRDVGHYLYSRFAEWLWRFPEIAACAAGIPPGVVLKDAAYGANTGLRTALTSLSLAFVGGGIQPNTSVWVPGKRPLPPKASPRRGRRASRTH
jgi:SRSO17 transposase